MSDEDKNNGLSKLLESLNLPKNWLVVVIILLSGGGNYLNTSTGNTNILRSTAREEDVSKALSEIHELHGQIDKFADRQKQILAALKVSPTPNQ